MGHTNTRRQTKDLNLFGTAWVKVVAKGRGGPPGWVFNGSRNHLVVKAMILKLLCNIYNIPSSLTIIELFKYQGQKGLFRSQGVSVRLLFKCNYCYFLIISIIGRRGELTLSYAYSSQGQLISDKLSQKTKFKVSQTIFFP